MKNPFSYFSRKARSHGTALAVSPNTGGEFISGRVIQSSRVEPGHAAALREHADFNRKQLGLATRMYEAAMTNNLNADFIPKVSSANAEVQTSKYISRGRARTLCDDFAAADGVLRTMANNVCGHDPFRLDMKVGKWTGEKNAQTFELETETNREIQDAWAEVKLPENLTVRCDMGYVELCHQTEKSTFRDGDVIARIHDNFPHNKFGFALEMIESDRLQENYMGRADVTGNQIRFSIERDKWNRPVAYWILTRHPGDIYPYNGFNTKTFRERVPADEIIHVNNLRNRAEQDVGFTGFNSVAQPLHRQRQWDVSYTSAAIQSAIKALWIKQEYPTGIQYTGDPNPMYNQVNQDMLPGNGNIPPQGDGKGGGVDKWDNMKPGQARLMELGRSLQQLDPKFPMEAASNFRRDNHLDVATGTGLSYASVSADVKEMSFSVARFSVLPERDNFKVRQEMMICNFVRKHFNAWLENYLLSGLTTLPYSRLEEFKKAAKFQAKRWPYIQPVQDAQADLIRIEGNIESRDGVLEEGERGVDFEGICGELANEEKIADLHGIDLHQEVTLATIKKGEPGEVQPDPDNTPAKTNGRFHFNGHTDLD